jgi:putative FmdB family regulatory protein
MPIFDFTCPKCDCHEDDVIVARDGVDRICPSCGCRMKRKVSVFHPVFNGDGWTPTYHGKRGEA